MPDRRQEMKHVLITGGAGYIGSILTPALLDAGYRVTVLDTFVHGASSLSACCVDERFDLVRGDARLETVMRPLVARSDVIIPLAAVVGMPQCDRDPIAARTVNLEAIELLCSLASADQLILFPNTNSGYGRRAEAAICTEDTPLEPISLYGQTKCAAERLVLARDNAISFRLATAFGMSPRMRFSLLVNDFVRRAVLDRTLVVFEGHFRRNFIHVRDIARAFIHGIGHFESMKGRAYNLGLDDANMSKIELCGLIRQYVPEFVALVAPIGSDPDQRDYIVSSGRILAAGFKPQWSLDRGIIELIKGLRQYK